MFKTILIVLLVAIAAFSIYVSMQPNDFSYERSVVINAPASEIFPEINSPRKVDTWSPWLEMDPNAKVTYSGDEEGVGATSSWSGNFNIGEGSATIIESRPNEFVKTELKFLRPMKATNTGEFVLEESNGQTKVTWIMYGKANFIGKAMNIIFNCEKMIGEQFDKGLNKLKNLVEAR